MLAITATAAPPATGTVVEGRSLPGVALGATRAQVEQAWGAPSSCLPGKVLCSWHLTDGTVELAFAGRHGHPPKGTAKDRLSAADWSGIPGWVTTAGVSTASAQQDPESVVAAYPGAPHYRYADGHLRLVIDLRRGIEVDWTLVGSSYVAQVDLVPAGG